MRVAKTTTAPDGTKKFLIELDDGKLVESVLIFHKRTVCACLSSQVGCAMKCSFCATGKMGFKRNLSADEIIGQFDLMDDVARITNVVFMGMGEPLHNYDNVVESINVLRSKGLSWKKITLSTVGLPDKIVRLGKDTQCRLALSLHAPNDELRSKLVPVNTRFKIQEVLDACKEYPSHRHNPVMVEYVLLAGVNDRPEHARQLAGLLKQLKFCDVNLIPYNPVSGIEYGRPTGDSASAFKQILVEAGFKTIIRTTKGIEEKMACGMLATS